MGEFAVAEDRSENVIEVVRNTARQGTDGLHLLRLSQLRFQLLLVDLRLLLRGYIARRTDESQRLARRVARTAAARGQPAPIAVRLTDAVLAFIAVRAPLEMVIGCGLEAGPGGGVK